ncbi:MAG: sensor histidine kinase [Planctomycetota bacterium]|nr:MAG: sensor histidine kinase [Planctomycetota bacterium]
MSPESAVILAGCAAAVWAAIAAVRRSKRGDPHWSPAVAFFVLAVRQAILLWGTLAGRFHTPWSLEAMILLVPVVYLLDDWSSWRSRPLPIAPMGANTRPDEPIPDDGTPISETARREARELIHRHEQEQQMLAYEIHDGFVQEAAAALMNLQAWQARAAENGEDGIELIDQAERLLREAVGDARRLVRGLRPALLDEGGPVPAIENFLHETAAAHPEVAIEFMNESRFHRLPLPLETAVFRIVQEAVNNAVRHAQASKIVVRLEQPNGDLVIEVRDDGRGFDPQKIPGGHFGVIGLYDRAASFGGRAEIDSAPGRGTTVRAVLPLRATDPASADSEPSPSQHA